MKASSDQLRIKRCAFGLVDCMGGVVPCADNNKC